MSHKEMTEGSTGPKFQRDGIHKQPGQKCLPPAKRRRGLMPKTLARPPTGSLRLRFGTNDLAQRANQTYVIRELMIVMVSLGIISLIAPDNIGVALCFIIPAICFYILWQRISAPILAIWIGMHLLDIVPPMLLAAIEGRNLDSIYNQMPALKATVLSLFGCLVASITMASICRKKQFTYIAFKHEVEKIRLDRAVIVYLVVSLLAAVMGQLNEIGGVRHIIYFFVILRWAMLLLLLIVAVEGKHFLTFIVFVMVEFLIGWMSFFSSFKTIFFAITVVVILITPRFSLTRIVGTLSVASLGVFFVIIWLAIRPEYRQYLAQGRVTQVVSVGRSQQMNKIVELLAAVEGEDFWRAIKVARRKFGYTEYFSCCIDTVPKRVPHEKGKLLAGAMEHIAKPRFLFPNKAILEDSLITRKYTLIGVAGIESATSIGIGYYAEAYVDFGSIGMFFTIGLFATLFAWFYRSMLAIQSFRTIAVSMVGAVVICCPPPFGTSTPKLLGALILYWIASAMFLKFFGPFVTKYICKEHPL